MGGNGMYLFMEPRKSRSEATLMCSISASLYTGFIFPLCHRPASMAWKHGNMVLKLYIRNDRLLTRNLPYFSISKTSQRKDQRPPWSKQLHQKWAGAASCNKMAAAGQWHATRSCGGGEESLKKVVGKESIKGPHYTMGLASKPQETTSWPTLDTWSSHSTHARSDVFTHAVLFHSNRSTRMCFQTQFRYVNLGLGCFFSRGHWIGHVLCVLRMNENGFKQYKLHIGWLLTMIAHPTTVLGIGVNDQYSYQSDHKQI